MEKLRLPLSNLLVVQECRGRDIQSRLVGSSYKGHSGEKEREEKSA